VIKLTDNLRLSQHQMILSLLVMTSNSAQSVAACIRYFSSGSERAAEKCVTIKCKSDQMHQQALDLAFASFSRCT